MDFAKKIAVVPLGLMLSLILLQEVDCNHCSAGTVIDSLILLLYLIPFCAFFFNKCSNL